MKAKGLDEIFDVEPIKKESDKADRSLEPDNSSDIVVLDSDNNTETKKLEDSGFIRDTLKGMVEKSSEALDSAVDSQEEEPGLGNASSVSMISDSINKSIKNLLKLNELEHEVLDEKKNPSTPSINNSQVIIATTDEMISKITKQIKSEK